MPFIFTNVQRGGGNVGRLWSPSSWAETRTTLSTLEVGSKTRKMKSPNDANNVPCGGRWSMLSAHPRGKISRIYIFFKLRFNICFSERKRHKSGRGRERLSSRLPAERGAGRGAHNREIVTREPRVCHSTHWAIQVLLQDAFNKGNELFLGCRKRGCLLITRFFN